MHVEAGQVLFREGDVGDSLYMVISGRLRALQDQPDGTREVVGEYGQGDSLGEVEVITKGPRSVTLHSIRDSELARMPTTLFNAIALWHPPVTLQISRIIARRMRMEMDTRETARRMALPPHLAATIGRGQSTPQLQDRRRATGVHGDPHYRLHAAAAVGLCSCSGRACGRLATEQCDSRAWPARVLAHGQAKTRWVAL